MNERRLLLRVDLVLHLALLLFPARNARAVLSLLGLGQLLRFICVACIFVA